MLNRCFGTRDEQRRDFLTLDRADDAARVKQEAIIAIGISQDCWDFGASFHRETCSYS